MHRVRTLQGFSCFSYVLPSCKWVSSLHVQRMSSPHVHSHDAHAACHCIVPCPNSKPCPEVISLNENSERSKKEEKNLATQLKEKPQFLGGCGQSHMNCLDDPGCTWQLGNQETGYLPSACHQANRRPAISEAGTTPRMEGRFHHGLDVQVFFSLFLCLQRCFCSQICDSYAFICIEPYEPSILPGVSLLATKDHGNHRDHGDHSDHKAFASFPCLVITSAQMCLDVA